LPVAHRQSPVRRTQSRPLLVDHSVNSNEQLRCWKKNPAKKPQPE